MAKRPINDGSGDNEELQALFDSIASEANKPKAPAADASGDSADLQDLFDEVQAKYSGSEGTINLDMRSVRSTVRRTQHTPNMRITLSPKPNSRIKTACA